MGERPKAIVLLSGGIDSAVAAAMMREKYRLIGLTIEYGQPTVEKVAAVHIKDWLGCEVRLCRIPSFGASREPSHYFPVRNILFLSQAALEASYYKATTIIIGANKDDYNDYPDCRDEFFKAMELTLTLGSFNKWTIERPLVNMTKAEVVQKALKFGVPLEKTISCYRPINEIPCGKCNACKLRILAYRANGLEYKLEKIPRQFKHKVDA